MMEWGQAKIEWAYPEESRCFLFLVYEYSPTRDRHHVPRIRRRHVHHLGLAKTNFAVEGLGLLLDGEGSYFSEPKQPIMQEAM